MTAPDWLYDAIFYQIFPDRFARSAASPHREDLVDWEAAPTRDNFFGGDFAGITEHLDHFQAVGANALYLTPIFQAETNHRYDCVDYFAVDPLLGTDDDFHRFLDACHHRGIRVVLDAVFNHCGYGHWAFQDALARQEDSPYVNWYSIESFPVVTEPAPNYRTCSGCWYLPKWNAYNPEVRRHLYSVARHWIDQGIDGWRLDVPYFINHNFWRGFHEEVKGLGQDLYIVAEEWRDPEEWLQGDIADGTMNYTFRDLVLAFVADQTIDAPAFVAGMERLQDRIPEGHHHGMLNLLGSHDTERVLTRCGDDQTRLCLALTLLFCSQGAPMLYYGDEIGMRGGNDPDCRAGMVWDQGQWSQTIVDQVRGLARLRTDQEALRRGAQSVSALDPDTLVVSRTTAGAEVRAVIHRGRGTRVRLDGAAFDLPPLSSAVLTRDLGPAGEWTVALGPAVRREDGR